MSIIRMIKWETITDDSSPEPPTDSTRQQFERPRRTGPVFSAKDRKARQSAKIGEIGEALIATGFRSLDEQAKVLGLSRSTTWSILKVNHKGSGLSATIINRMLAAPRLPARVRTKIMEYIDEKVAGLYGHSKEQLRRFTAQLLVTRQGKRA